MFRGISLQLAALALTGTAIAQTGPGLGNLTYSSGEVFSPVGYIESPEGHGNVTMVQGYLLVIYSSDGGGGPNDGGIELWDVSNPRVPVRVAQYDDASTHGLREAHGFSLARYDGRLILAAQGGSGIQLWDVTNPLAIQLLSYLSLPGITEGDYSGDWWLFWQAPHVYVAGVDRGLYVVDATIPEAPLVAAEIPTGDLGGISPAQVFVVGNLAVIMESQGGDMATLDVSEPTRPRILRQFSGRAGYSHLFAGDGKILTSGSIPPRAHFLQVTHDGDIAELDSVGFFFNSGGYGSYQDGIFHSGFSNNYAKFQITPPMQLGTGSSGRTDRDEDFATVLGNIVVAGDDHGVGTALIPHQAAPDTTPPIVEWMHPAAGSTRIAPTSRIGLSFSDHVDASSLDTATVRLEDDNGATVPTRASAQMGLVNLAPLAELEPLRTYRVIAEGVRDVAGNPSPRFEATITTGDGSAPSSPLAAVTHLSRNSGFGTYTLGVFAEGKRVYSDRTYTFTAQFPARFAGQVYVQTANLDRINFASNFLSFELLTSAEVLVLYDARASSRPSWMSNFTATGETVVTTDTPLDVYARRYPAGTVTLGGNNAQGADGAESMYSVVIIPDPLPCAVDLAPVLTGTVTLAATGPAGATYDWRVGSRTLTGATPSIFLAPGRHSIRLSVTSGPLAATCGGLKIAHRPLLAEPARVATRLVWHGGDTLNVNPDHGSVTRVDPTRGTIVWESVIGGDPQTLAVHQDEVFVVERRGARVVVLGASDGRTKREITLPRASAPYGLVLDPSGTAWVTLTATGEVAKISGERILDRKFVTPTARGLTWLDGKLWVTRFISPDDRGEVHVLDADTLEVIDLVVLPFDRGPDTEASGRGVPNYVAEVQLANDGVTGYVASKKDNVARGLYRDGQPLTFESRVRTIVSAFDVATSSAALTRRLDINDRDLVLTTATSPLADLLFVASQGANTIDVFDTAEGRRVTQFTVGRAPQAMALDGTATTLAVFNYLSRTVSYHDVAGLLAGTSNAAEERAVVTTVATEALSPTLLEGKRIFHDAADDRMSRDNYISCASCHFEGAHDGRTWDFTQAGEGLRNTIALNGRAGLGHGRVHWTANFDEIQDFENDIRNAFGGRGFLTDDDYAATSDPLGPAKAGKSPDLDALAAYVASLTDYPPSPHRNEDGTLTEAARRGREVFRSANCQQCHAGATFTDGLRHDVGTITPASGRGQNQPLTPEGLDTPTLRSLWATAPYLHDGSAPTLEAALTRHTQIPPLTADDTTDLVAYLQQLDGTSLPPEANCTEAPNECVQGPELDAGVAPDATTATDASPADAGTPPDATGTPEGCACTGTESTTTTSPLELLVACATLLIAARRRAQSAITEGA
ncbi:Ig-like domain-containing protein [Myxococcota bacterium]|nr:Ig-like domain-containing protein [Myxococcota bacterium]